MSEPTPRPRPPFGPPIGGTSTRPIETAIIPVGDSGCVVILQTTPNAWGVDFPKVVRDAHDALRVGNPIVLPVGVTVKEKRCKSD